MLVVSKQFVLENPKITVLLSGQDLEKYQHCLRFINTKLTAEYPSQPLHYLGIGLDTLAMLFEDRELPTRVARYIIEAYTSIPNGWRVELIESQALGDALIFS